MEMRAEIASVRGEISSLRAEMRGEIALVRAEIGTLREHINGRINELEAKMIKWVVATGFSSLGIALAMTALLK